MLSFITVAAVKSPFEKTRYETSLGLLTKRFVGLLRSAPDGVRNHYYRSYLTKKCRYK